MAPMNTTAWVKTYQQRVADTLSNVLDNTPGRLFDAMRYTTLNGGKRLRPLLVYAVGLSLDGNLKKLDLAAASIELIHCYSLVHDDLPAMDDDDLRRGKPSCHKAFDEATAILVGDALQTLAYTVLCLPNTLPNQLEIIKTLTEASGANGMVGGQALDIYATQQTINIEALQQIHHLKTGSLFHAAIRMGALAAGCTDEKTLEKLQILAEHLGLAFQIQDDILDIESTTDALGKTSGKDVKQHKATYPAHFGIQQSKVLYNTHLDKALNLASSYNLHQLTNLIEAFLKHEAIAA